MKKMELQSFAVKVTIGDREKILKIPGEADVLVLPLRDSRFIELGVSLKLYEYQASDKPIFCSSNGQLRTYVSVTRS